MTCLGVSSSDLKTGPPPGTLGLWAKWPVPLKLGFFTFWGKWTPLQPWSKARRSPKKNAHTHRQNFAYNSMGSEIVKAYSWSPGLEIRLLSEELQIFIFLYSKWLSVSGCYGTQHWIKYSAVCKFPSPGLLIPALGPWEWGVLTLGTQC